MTYKECGKCGEYLPIEEFYQTKKTKTKSVYIFPRCIQCCREEEQQKERDRIEEQGGSNRVLLKPNKYVDDIQRQQTFQFLTLLGWKFNEENGVWYDDIKKTKDGEFIGVLKKSSNRTICGQEVTFTLETLPDYRFKRNRNSLPQEIQRAILINYYIDMENQYEISRKYNTSHQNIANIIKRFNQRHCIYLRRHSRSENTNERKLLNEQYLLYGLKPRVSVQLDELPLVLPKNHPQFTEDIVRQIQYDYFYLRYKVTEIEEKYEHLSSNVARYIVSRTITKYNNI